MVDSQGGDRPHRTTEIVNAGLKRRYRSERVFKLYGIAALAVAMGMLA